MPVGTFSATLTTDAFDASRSRWFATRPCRPIARGHAVIDCSFSHLLRRLLRHTDVGHPQRVGHLSGELALYQIGSRTGNRRRARWCTRVCVGLPPAGRPRASTAPRACRPPERLARRARRVHAACHRCGESVCGYPGCARAAARRTAPAPRGCDRAMRRSRWWRLPGPCTWLPPDRRPGTPSRIRILVGPRVGLPCEPGRGFCQDLALKLELPILPA